MLHAIQTIKHSATDTDSSFTQDLTRMTWITHHLHPRSLVLIDEFGKGTAPQGKERIAMKRKGWMD